MRVTLYNYSGEKIVVVKTLTNGVSTQCWLKEDTSIIHPSILFDRSTISVDISTINYCFILEFNRYYFVDDIIYDTNKLIRLNLTVDVLMSYREFLFRQKALLRRNQHIIDAEGAQYGYQIDERMPFSNDYKVEFNTVGDPIFGALKSFTVIAMTFFSSSKYWIPTNGVIDPYGTLSVTVLIYAVTTGDELSPLLKELFGRIVSDREKYGSYISSMRIVPFDSTRFNDKKLDRIYIGADDVGIDLTPFTNEFVYTINATETEPRLNIGNTNILTYKDLPPYTEYKVYLPRIGLVDIPIEAFRSSKGAIRIYLDTAFDFTVGVITYKLMYVAEQPTVFGTPPEIMVVFYENSVECMNPLPVSSSNAGTVDRTKDAYLASSIGQIVSSALTAVGSIGVSVATANPAAAVGGITAFSSSIISGVKIPYDLKRMVPSGSTYTASSVYSTMDLINQNVTVTDHVGLIRIIRRPLLDNTEYYELNGHICNITASLDTVYGYTEIADIHLNIPSILTEESDMLISLLTNGVIFPPKPT